MVLVTCLYVGVLSALYIEVKCLGYTFIAGVLGIIKCLQSKW